MRKIWLSLLLIPLLLHTSSARAQTPIWDKHSAEEFLLKAESLVQAGRPTAEI